MRVMLRAVLLLCGLMLAGCATTRVPTGPQVYSDGGITFSLPAKWKITMQGRQQTCSYAFVEAPGAAVLFIQGMPHGKDPGVAKFAADFSPMATPNVSQAKVTASKPVAFTDPRYGSALRETFTVATSGEKVPHTRTYRALKFDSCTYYLVTQVADDEAAAARSGFDEIFSTFKAK